MSPAVTATDGGKRGCWALVIEVAQHVQINYLGRSLRSSRGAKSLVSIVKADFDTSFLRVKHNKSVIGW